MKTNFSFEVIFFIPGNELSKSVKAFLVLCFISLPFFFKKYRVPQVVQVAQVAQIAQVVQVGQVAQVVQVAQVAQVPQVL